MSVYILSYQDNNEHGKGYRILKPSEQIQRAMQDGIERAKKEIRKATQRGVVCVRVDELDQEGRKCHMENLSKLSWLSDKLSKVKSIEFFPEN